MGCCWTVSCGLSQTFGILQAGREKPPGTGFLTGPLPLPTLLIRSSFHCWVLPALGQVRKSLGCQLWGAAERRAGPGHHHRASPVAILLGDCYKIGLLVDLLILYNQVFWDLVTRSLCVISHIPNLQDEGEMQRPFFAPSRHQVGPDPSPLLSPRALRTGLLSGCSSPIIPLDAKARLLSVFLALRAVPKLCAPTCLFFNSFDLSSLGAGQLLATCFL